MTAQSIILHDKAFNIYINEEDIQERVKKIAQQINENFTGKEPVFISILNGSFFFTADLLRHIELPYEITFVRLASYMGSASSGKVKILLGLNHQIKGRDIIIVEDIIDSGRTMVQMTELLKEHQPASLSIATLLIKKEALTENIEPEYTGFEVENKFIVGYGLDYLEKGRNLKSLYLVKE